MQLAPPEIQQTVPMTVPTGNGRRSALKLEFGRPVESQVAVMEIKEQSWPLRVLRPFNHGSDATLIHLHNIGGGILAGDHLEVDIAVDHKAHLVVTTTSAQRIYRHLDGLPFARQKTTFRIGSGSRVEYLPDPNIPFNDSAFEQFSRWDLARGGAMLAWDTMAPGRCAYERDFGFRYFRNDAQIFYNGRPLYIERYTLHSKKDINHIIRCDSFNHMGTLLFVDGTLSDSDCTQLESQLQTLLNELSPALLGDATTSVSIGVSALVAHGLIVRVLGHRQENINHLFELARDFLLKAVWGETSPRPRKIY